MTKTTADHDLGIVGYSARWEPLIRNWESKGFRIAVLHSEPVGGGTFVATTEGELTSALKRPRKVLVLDDTRYDEMAAVLESGDLLIDACVSPAWEFESREVSWDAKGLRRLDVGIIGTSVELGAGAMILVGGDVENWNEVKALFQAVAARSPEGDIACDRVGAFGAGSFCRAVYESVESAETQLICESFHLFSGLLVMRINDLCEVFARWNNRAAGSRLIEAAIQTVRRVDAESEGAFLETVLDVVAGTPSDFALLESAVETGTPVPTLAAAAFARTLSGQKDRRSAANRNLFGPTPSFFGGRAAFVADVENGVAASKIIALAQAFDLLASRSLAKGWDIPFPRVAALWNMSGMLRGTLLTRVLEAYARDPNLPHLLLDPGLGKLVQDIQDGWRRVISSASLQGLPLPTLAASLSYFDAFRTARLPTYLAAALGDYAHGRGYERVDKPRGELHYADWK